MAYSSYQLERLIDRLRRLAGWLARPAHTRWRGADPVRLSRAAAQQGAAPGAAGQGPARKGTPPSLAAVRDPRSFPPPVEEERERRAGSFMQPPYPDEAPPGRIPRIARPPAPRRRARSLAEGD